MHDLIAEIRANLQPELLPLFETLAQEAQFGRAWLAEDLASLKPDARILEVGGGILLLACQLRREGFDVTAIEPTGDGFGAFEKLREKVLETSAKHGTAPKVAACNAEDFESTASFDFAFSVNVMEHVNDPAQVIARVRSALAPNASYRFLCPNYYFPYEPHFNIPTVVTKNITGKLFSGRIFSNKTMEDPAGVWNSLNWINTCDVRRSARSNDLSLTYRRDTLAWMLKRVLSDAAFASRRAGWMIGAIRLAARLKLIDLAKFIPAPLQPVMDCRLTKKG